MQKEKEKKKLPDRRLWTLCAWHGRDAPGSHCWAARLDVWSSSHRSAYTPVVSQPWTLTAAWLPEHTSQEIQYCIRSFLFITSNMLIKWPQYTVSIHKNYCKGWVILDYCWYKKICLKKARFQNCVLILVCLFIFSTMLASVVIFIARKSKLET